MSRRGYPHSSSFIPSFWRDRAWQGTSGSESRQISRQNGGIPEALEDGLYAGQIVREPAMENPTLVVFTDRNDLVSRRS